MHRFVSTISFNPTQNYHTDYTEFYHHHHRLHPNEQNKQQIACHRRGPLPQRVGPRVTAISCMRSFTTWCNCHPMTRSTFLSVCFVHQSIHWHSTRQPPSQLITSFGEWWYAICHGLHSQWQHTNDMHVSMSMSAMTLLVIFFRFIASADERALSPKNDQHHQHLQHREKEEISCKWQQQNQNWMQLELEWTNNNRFAFSFYSPWLHVCVFIQILQLPYRYPCQVCDDESVSVTSLRSIYIFIILYLSFLRCNF